MWSVAQVKTLICNSVQKRLAIIVLACNEGATLLFPAPRLSTQFFIHINVNPTFALNDHPPRLPAAANVCTVGIDYHIGQLLLASFSHTQLRNRRLCLCRCCCVAIRQANVVVAASLTSETLLGRRSPCVQLGAGEPAVVLLFC